MAWHSDDRWDAACHTLYLFLLRQFLYDMMWYPAEGLPQQY
jgi:hypothetical protein